MTRTKSSRALLSVVLAVLMAAAFMPSLTYSSFAATAKKATKVTKLNHTGSKVYGKVGSKYVLKYKLSPKKLTSSAQKTVWKSSDSSVVKVIAKAGKHATVKVKGVGTAKITVYTKANKKAKAVWSFKTKKVEAAAPTIDTSKVQTTYGLSTQYNMVDKSITTADLLKNVTAKDANGKDVTVSIASIKEDGSTTGIQRIDPKIAENGGVFDVTYTATDSEGNTATKTIKVTVKNQTPEVVANNFSISINSKDWKDLANRTDYIAKYLIDRGIVSIDDFESFKSTDKASDKTVANFEKISGNRVDVTKVTDSTGKALEIVDKNDSKNNKPDLTQIKTDRAGTYNVTYKVTDFLGASVEKTVTVTVQNNTAPTIATTTANVYEGSKDNAADVRAQLTYNDTEDGNNVKVSSVPENKDVTVNFVDQYGTIVKESDPHFYDKVAGAWIVNVRDKDGAYAASKLITITPKKGLVLTAKDQVVELSTSAHKLDTADLMSYISATLNGQAYALDNPATVRNGNTTIKVTDANGKEATIFSDTTGTYNVTYTVKATVDGHEFVASKTIKVKVQDSAKEGADEVAALIAKAKAATDTAVKKGATDAQKESAKAAVKAARTAYDKLTAAAQAKVNNYKDLVDAETSLANAEQEAKDSAQAAAVATHLKNADTVEAVEKAVAEFDGLTTAQKDDVVKIDGSIVTKKADGTYTIPKAEAAKNAKAVADSLKVVTKDGKANIVGTLPTGVTADKVTAVTYQEGASVYHAEKINSTNSIGWSQGANARTIEVKVTVDRVIATKTVTIPAK